MLDPVRVRRSANPGRSAAKRVFYGIRMHSGRPMTRWGMAKSLSAPGLLARLGAGFVAGEATG